MPFKWNPISGYLDLVNLPGTVESIESSKIIPTVGTIPASSSKIIESMTYSDFFAVRYFIALQSADKRTNCFDYFIGNSGSDTVKETVYGRLFGGLSLDVSTFVDTGLVKFTITNNELVEITYKVQKLGF
jgi:hypothetical protein